MTSACNPPRAERRFDILRMLSRQIDSPELRRLGGCCAPTVVRDAAPLGYTTQRRLLKLLLAGELPVSPEDYPAAMRDGWSVIAGWLASKSPRVQARGVRAFLQWQMAMIRTVKAALEEIAAAVHLDDADSGDLSDHDGPLLSQLRGLLDEERARQGVERPASNLPSCRATDSIAGNSTR